MVWLGPLIGDPNIMECHCRTCEHGGRCDFMTAWIEDHEQRQAIAYLTDEDRTWLRAHGWQG